MVNEYEHFSCITDMTAVHGSILTWRHNCLTYVHVFIRRKVFLVLIGKNAVVDVIADDALTCRFRRSPTRGVVDKTNAASQPGQLTVAVPGIACQGQPLDCGILEDLSFESRQQVAADVEVFH